MDEVDLRGLLRALAVSESGSFAGAARRLGVSRQAVHRSIDALEAQAGGALFDRGGRELRPTSLGRELLERAARLRQLERDVQAVMRAAASEPSGTVRVTAPPVFCETVLAVALTELSLAWPDVRIHVRADTARTDLVRDDVDLMIRVGAPPPDAHHAQRLGQATTVLCAAPAYIEARGVPRKPDGLRRHALLAYGHRHDGEWVLVSPGDSCTVAVEPAWMADSPRVVVEACLHGLGILRIPELAVAGHLRAGRLVEVLAPWRPPLAEVWAVYGHRTSRDPTLRELTRALQHAFADAEEPPRRHQRSH